MEGQIGQRTGCCFTQIAIGKFIAKDFQ